MEEETREIKKKKSKKEIIKAIMPVVIKFVVVAAVLWIGFTFVFGLYRYEGNNMYPMLKDGDLCITYKLKDYYTGDIVFFYVDGKLHSGRIIATPGDTIDADEQGILVNGLHIPEEIFYETDMSSAESLPIQLDDKQFYILNDYRSDLKDSRYFGIIEKNNFKGKLIFLFRRRGF